ncbi:MAG: helix-turn-helix domain-containing protein [Bacteroidota bacterium]
MKGYYVHVDKAPNFEAKVTFYQNITTTISIYRDSTTSGTGRIRVQRHQAGKGFSAVLAGLVDKYQEVEFYGPLDRVAIVFYPGGINHFIRVALGSLLERHYSLFTYFEAEFDHLLPQVYETPDLETKRDLLDTFLMEQFQPLDEPELYQAIDLLQQADPMYKVADLAEKLELSRRTLLRKFKKHLGYSVEEYTSVIKFRRALLSYQQQQQAPDLSSIAYDSRYYDQADFNHQLKARSGLTPRALFAQLNIVDDTLFWKI